MNEPKKQLILRRCVPGYSFRAILVKCCTLIETYIAGHRRDSLQYVVNVAPKQTVLFLNFDTSCNKY